MTNMKNNWEEKMRDEVFAELAPTEDWRQRYLVNVVFPFIHTLIRETEQRVREEKIDAFKTTAEFAKVAAEIRKDATEKTRSEIKRKIEQMKDEHVVDSELYDDTCGAIMCENCGAGGTSPEWDKECLTERNAIINEILATISKEKNEKDYK